MDKLKKEGFFYGALIYAFMIPFPPKFVTISLLLWGLLSFISFNKEQLNKNRFLWVLPAFYFLYFIGFFTSENFTLKFLEYKLSLVVFPLLFFLHNYDAKKRRILLKIFLYGLLISGVISLLIATFSSLHFEDGTWFFQPNVLKGRLFIESISYGGNYFFGKDFSVFHQTVYYALYLSIGIAVLLFHSEIFERKNRNGALFFLIILLFLVSNKASFIALAITFIYWITTLKLKWTKKGLGLLIITLSVATLILLNPRAKASIQNVMNGNVKIDKKARYGFATRLLSWNAAITLIKEQPVLGYSNSDTQSKLNETYASKEFAEPLKQSLNAHNLWLQIWLENGIIAVLLLLSIFGILIFSAMKQPEYYVFGMAVILILFTNTLFESLFSRFSGISFFAFLFCFIITKSDFAMLKKADK